MELSDRLLDREEVEELVESITTSSSKEELMNKKQEIKELICSMRAEDHKVIEVLDRWNELDEEGKLKCIGEGIKPSNYDIEMEKYTILTLHCEPTKVGTKIGATFFIENEEKGLCVRIRITMFEVFGYWSIYDVSDSIFEDFLYLVNTGRIEIENI